jgi:hypothetical protein
MLVAESIYDRHNPREGQAYMELLTAWKTRLSA